MPTRIRNIDTNYSKFGNILPEELLDLKITEELKTALDEINKIFDEDSRYVQTLAARANKAIVPTSPTLESLIKMGFYIREDQAQDKILLLYAHWIMSATSLQLVAQAIINLSGELKEYCGNYIKGTGQDKRNAFEKFMMTYYNFKGYLINLHSIITQYHDNLVYLCNELDPSLNEQPNIAGKSDLGYQELIAATEDLLLRGNRGRRAGFSSIRSALEVYITRELFSLKYSRKYAGKQVNYPKDIPSIKSICRRIEKNTNLSQFFNTDTLKRLYEWQSIVAHRGILTEEYVTWFVYYHTSDILGEFRMNLQQHCDGVLDELQKDGLIQIS